MHSLNSGRPTKERFVHQQAKNRSGDHDELISPPALSQNNILHLQRLIGNHAVQRLLAEEKPANAESRHPTHATGLPTLRTAVQPKAQPDIQRCSCGGTCAKCQHKQEEQMTTPQLQREMVIQRWWDDGEETHDGGSWTDAVTDTIGGWSSGEETETTDTSGGYYEPEDSGGGEGGGYYEPEDSGGEESSWWDKWWEDDEDESEPTDGEEAESEVTDGVDEELPEKLDEAKGVLGQLQAYGSDFDLECELPEFSCPQFERRLLRGNCAPAQKAAVEAARLAWKNQNENLKKEVDSAKRLGAGAITALIIAIGLAATGVGAATPGPYAAIVAAVTGGMLALNKWDDARAARNICHNLADEYYKKKSAMCNAAADPAQCPPPATEIKPEPPADDFDFER